MFVRPQSRGDFQIPKKGGRTMSLFIDLRSDTVTQPTLAMREAMARAEVGDDVMGEDPTVNALEKKMAERAGTEESLFVTSGTQANLLAVMSHCERGDEFISGQQSHVYRWEAGGAAVLGSVQPQPIQNEADGTIDIDLIEENIKPDDSHFARTRLICLENTIGGKVLPLSYLKRVRSLADRHGLQMHLDGARAFNAAVKLGVELKSIAEPFDSISICLSKGLGAPVGSMLCGNREFIAKARRLRKMLGGGMRQAGILAAAGIYALENHVERLQEDHENAKALAEGLSGLPGLELDLSKVQTNMVFARLTKHSPEDLEKELKALGILIFPDPVLRLVTHLDISAEDIRSVIDAFKRVCIK